MQIISLLRFLRFKTDFVLFQIRINFFKFIAIFEPIFRHENLKIISEIDSTPTF